VATSKGGEGRGKGEGREREGRGRAPPFVIPGYVFASCDCEDPILPYLTSGMGS